MADRNLDLEMENIKADLGKLRSDLASISEGLKNIGVEEALRTKAAIADMAQKVLEEARSTFESAKGKGKDSADAVQRQIENRPFVSLLAAFGAGILLGKIMDRR